jgi:hypothetical protein
LRIEKSRGLGVEKEEDRLGCRKVGVKKRLKEGEGIVMKRVVTGVFQPRSDSGLGPAEAGGWGEGGRETTG